MASFNRPTKYSVEESKKIITDVAKENGKEPWLLLTFGEIESNFRHNVYNSLGYRGLFQFGKQAWADTLKVNYPGDAFDPWKNTKAAIQLMDKNESRLKNKGITMEPWMYYFAHQQGAGGASWYIRNADEKIKDIPDKWKNAMSWNVPGGKSTVSKWESNGETVRKFLDFWKNKFGKIAKKYKGSEPPKNEPPVKPKGDKPNEGPIASNVKGKYKKVSGSVMPNGVDGPDQIWSYNKLKSIVSSKGLSISSKDYVVIVGVRYFYSKKEQRNVYDDAAFVVTDNPDEFIGVPMNTQPSKFGSNTSTGVAGSNDSHKGYAVLQTGIHNFGYGPHTNSKVRASGALRQYSTVTSDKFKIRRDGYKTNNACREGRVMMAAAGINFHPGASNYVGSAGCQTFHPDVWKQFQPEYKKAMDRKGTKLVKYILIEGYSGQEATFSRTPRYPDSDSCSDIEQIAEVDTIEDSTIAEAQTSESLASNSGSSSISTTTGNGSASDSSDSSGNGQSSGGISYADLFASLEGSVETNQAMADLVEKPLKKKNVNGTSSSKDHESTRIVKSTMDLDSLVIDPNEKNVCNT